MLGDGFNTYEKVNKAYLLMLAVSLLAGLGGMVWFFVMGLISIFRYRSRALGRPETLGLFGLLGLVLPIPLFLSQSFMALGDLTPASALLAVATAGLPLAMIAVWLKTRMRPSFGSFQRVHQFAAICVIQWCMVLAAYGMLPLMLWR